MRKKLRPFLDQVLPRALSDSLGAAREILDRGTHGRVELAGGGAFLGSLAPRDDRRKVSAFRRYAQDLEAGLGLDKRQKILRHVLGRPDHEQENERTHDGSHDLEAPSRWMFRAIDSFAASRRASRSREPSPPCPRCTAPEEVSRVFRDFQKSHGGKG